MGVERFSHLGLCVSDLARSLRFYCEGLGFRETSRLAVSGKATDTLLELEAVRLEAVYLLRDGLCLELLHYAAPPAFGDGAPRAMNAQGLTHLSLRVEALDEVVSQLASVGGRALAHTRIDNPALGARAIFVLDPDGTRIELVESSD
jgi:catechol 2,3-dioxygenase-like lactoylglutathione lyase family enzyme